MEWKEVADETVVVGVTVIRTKMIVVEVVDSLRSRGIYLVDEKIQKENTQGYCWRIVVQETWYHMDLRRKRSHFVRKHQS
jgi:hypothetical protein